MSEPVVALGHVPVAFREGPAHEDIISGGRGKFCIQGRAKSQELKV